MEDKKERKNRKIAIKGVLGKSNLKVVYEAPHYSCHSEVRTEYGPGWDAYAPEKVESYTEHYVSTKVYIQREYSWRLPDRMRRIGKKIIAECEKDLDALKKLERRGMRYKALAEGLSKKWNIELVLLNTPEEITAYHKNMREKVEGHNRDVRWRYRGYYNRGRRY